MRRGDGPGVSVLNRRLLLSLPLLMFLLSGSGCGDRPAVVEYEGREYHRLALAELPSADLRPVGTATLTNVSDITDRTVLALKDVDPTILIVLRIDPAKVDTSDSDRQARPYAVLGVSNLETFPEVACRYFDPRDEGTPIDCQVPITVAFEGRRYRSLESYTVAKAGPAGLRFLPSDVAPAGPLADIDPRLGDVESRAYTIDGVAPTEAIVVVRGTGVDAERLPFVAESERAMPASMCRFLDVSDPDIAGAPAPAGCKPVDATAARAILDRLHQHERTWAAEEVVSYTLTLEVRCDCPPEARGPFTIVVRDGDIVAEVAAGGQKIAETDPRLAWAPLRVNDLFETIARYAHVRDVEIQYDSSFGYPITFLADPEPGATGDEYGFTVSGFGRK